MGVQSHCDSWMLGHAPAFSRALGERGWVGMTLPTEYGGGAKSSVERYVVVEELLAAGAPVAAHWFADRQVGPALLRHGTDVQKQRYLPGICRGELYFAIGMSEPDSGSDLASIRTRATEAVSDWRLTGSKVWTSHAHVAQHALVLARTDPPHDGDRRTGLSQFLVDLRLPGVQIRPIVTLDGGHHFNEVLFTEVELKPDAMLGVRGQGWPQVMQELAMERSGPERFLSTMPLLREFITRIPEAQADLGLLLAELRSLRAMSMSVAEALGGGEIPTVAAAMVKDVGTRFERRVVEAVRASGLVRPDPDSSDDLARLLAEAIMHSPGRTLRGGANEVLRGIVANSLVAK